MRFRTLRPNATGTPVGDLRPIGNPHPIAAVLRNANGPVTIIVGEQVARDDARAELEALRAVLRARVATVPDAKDVAGTPGFGSSSALGVTGVMGHPGVAEAVAASAVCLVVGTRLSVTARTGLDDALASGADAVDRLGAALRSVHPRAHRRPAWLAAHADPGAVRAADGPRACGCPTWCGAPN